MDLGIPIWGQYSFTGLLFGALLWVVIAVLRGNLITGKRQDQEEARYKTELDTERERSRLWQLAWQESQNLASQQVDTVKHLSTLAEVFESFINSLPKEWDDEDT